MEEVWAPAIGGSMIIALNFGAVTG
ncbi:hypothetical protein [Paraglaciecola polaris]|nr:hypothetical protein [Paraglaciecola polaris]